MAAEFDIAGATYYAVAPSGYSYNGTQDTNYGARKYTTLAAAEAALPASASTPLVINILGEWASAETSALSFAGTTTSSTNFIRIRAIGSARHAGKWTTTAYRFDIAGNSTNGLTLSNQYTEAEGLQLRITFSSGATQYGGFYSSGANSGFRGCIAVGVVSGDSLGTKSGFRMQADQGNYSINCIAYDFIGATNSNVAGLQGGGMYNCTAYNCQFGIRRITGTVIAENCIAQACTDGFSGAFSGASSNNCSDITSDAPGTSPRTGSVAFIDAANRDLHLASSDTVALGYGLDLSSDPTFPFTVDIDDQPRGAVWDIGADQYVAAGGALSWSGSDALTLGDSAASAAAFASALADALSIGDSASVAAAYVVAATDGMAMVDQVGGSAAFAAALTDAIALADTYASAAALVRVISDGLTLDELVYGQILGSGLAAQISDAIALGDTVGASAMFARALADALSLEDTATTAAVFAALITEGLSVTDAVATAAAIVRAVSDDIALGELLAAYMGSGNIPALRGVITALRMRATIADQRLRGSIEKN